MAAIVRRGTNWLYWLLSLCCAFFFGLLGNQAHAAGESQREPAPPQVTQQPFFTPSAAEERPVPASVCEYGVHPRPPEPVSVGLYGVRNPGPPPLRRRRPPLTPSQARNFRVRTLVEEALRPDTDAARREDIACELATLGPVARNHVQQELSQYRGFLPPDAATTRPSDRDAWAREVFRKLAILERILEVFGSPAKLPEKPAPRRSVPPLDVRQGSIKERPVEE